MKYVSIAIVTFWVASQVAVWIMVLRAIWKGKC